MCLIYSNFKTHNLGWDDWIKYTYAPLGGRDSWDSGHFWAWHYGGLKAPPSGIFLHNFSIFFQFGEFCAEFIMIPYSDFLSICDLSQCLYFLSKGCQPPKWIKYAFCRIFAILDLWPLPRGQILGLAVEIYMSKLSPMSDLQLGNKV